MCSQKLWGPPLGYVVMLVSMCCATDLKPSAFTVSINGVYAIYLWNKPTDETSKASLLIVFQSLCSCSFYVGRKGQISDKLRFPSLQKGSKMST